MNRWIWGFRIASSAGKGINLMSIKKEHHEAFARFFEEPTRESLRDIIKGNIGETDYLDFKAEWPEKTALVRHILALANSGGGALVVGVSQDDNNELNAIGMPNFKDKANVDNEVNKYLPEEIKYIVLDFSYKESEYESIKGKKFQVLLVEYNPSNLPFMSRKAGSDLKNNTVYVRKGTKSEEANHNELQKIINERIETGYSSSHILELGEHLEQLKVLHRKKYSHKSTFSPLSSFSRFFEGDILEKYEGFLSELIDKKENVIRRELGIRELY